nr:unnamed protein product [Callosobruchus chinensis]
MQQWWSQQIVLVLLEEYKKKEILWKPRHPLYYNTIKKEDAWREIAEILNVDVQELKKNMESLKGSFRREKSRVKKGTGTGKGRDQIYISKCSPHLSTFILQRLVRPLFRSPKKLFLPEADPNPRQMVRPRIGSFAFVLICIPGLKHIPKNI